MTPANSVSLTGKVSRVGGLKYTPSGTPICEFTVAVPQRYFEKDSVGYFEALLCGKTAEDSFASLRIGRKLTLKGSLWARSFRNRQGIKVNETKVLVDSIEGESK